MKKIAALVTTLILGASTAALAAPNAPYERDHRAPYTQFRPRLPSWTTLASNESLSRGRDRVAVANMSRFTKLKIEASRGSMFIDKVVITFANGERQVVNLDKTLGRYTGGATIDLQGRARQITSISVSGKGGFRSGYSLSAA